MNHPTYQPVPVAEAKSISDRYSKNQVVILAYDSNHELTHATTYGVTAFDKENSAAIAALCVETIGGDLSKKISYEDFHEDMDPARFRETQEALHKSNCERAELLEQLSRIAEMLGRPGCRGIVGGRITLTMQTNYIVEAVQSLSRRYGELVDEMDD